MAFPTAPRAARAWALAAAALLPLAACESSPDAPNEPKVCFRLAAERPARFAVLDRGVSNLESCAALLEAVSLRDRRPEVAGAYQGQFIFITPDMIQSGLHYEGARYRLFDADTRAKIDRNLRWRLEDARHPSDFAPKPQRGATASTDAR